MFKILFLFLSVFSATHSFAATSNIQNVGNAGMNGTDFSAATQFSFTGLGTVSNDNKFCRRVGDSLECYGTVTQGTASGTASIDLSGLTINTAKLSSAGNMVVGSYVSAIDSNTYEIFNQTARAGVIFYDGSDNNSLFFAWQVTTSGLTKITGGVVNNTTSFTYKFSVPITGWTTGGSGASSICHFSVNQTSGSPVELSDPTNCVASYADGAGTGEFTATFTTAYSSATSFHCMASDESSNGDRLVNVDGRTASTVSIEGFVGSSGSQTDDYRATVFCVGN